MRKTCWQQITFSVYLFTTWESLSGNKIQATLVTPPILNITKNNVNHTIEEDIESSTDSKFEDDLPGYVNWTTNSSDTDVIYAPAFKIGDELLQESELNENTTEGSQMTDFVTNYSTMLEDDETNVRFSNLTKQMEFTSHPDEVTMISRSISHEMNDENVTASETSIPVTNTEDVPMVQDITMTKIETMPVLQENTSASSTEEIAILENVLSTSSPLIFNEMDGTLKSLSTSGIQSSTQILNVGSSSRHENNSTQKNYCLITIPNSLSYKIIMTFTLENSTEQNDVPHIFEHLLKEVFNDSQCSSIVRTSYVSGNVSTFSWTNLTVMESCDNNNIKALQHMMFNNTQISERFSNMFLPVFKLQNIIIERMGVCTDFNSQTHTIVVALMGIISVLPCIFITIVKLLHRSSVSRRKKVKDILRSRKPVVFDVEVGFYKPSKRSRYMNGISNETFLQDEVNS